VLERIADLFAAERTWAERNTGSQAIKDIA
jgi:hypothetical protein